MRASPDGTRSARESTVHTAILAVTAAIGLLDTYIVHRLHGIFRQPAPVLERTDHIVSHTIPAGSTLFHKPFSLTLPDGRTARLMLVRQPGHIRLYVECGGQVRCAELDSVKIGDMPVPCNPDAVCDITTTATRDLIVLSENLHFVGQVSGTIQEADLLRMLEGMVDQTEKTAAYRFSVAREGSAAVRAMSPPHLDVKAHMNITWLTDKNR